MRAAAKATLDRGYSHFKFSDAHAPTAGAAVTVVMFHANEPGAQGAFEAEQILKQYSQ